MNKARVPRGSPTTVLLARTASIVASFTTVGLLAVWLGPSGRGFAAAGISVVILLPLLLAAGTSGALRVRWALESSDRFALLRSVRIYAVAAGLLVGSVGLAVILIGHWGDEPWSVWLVILIAISVAFGIIWISNQAVSVGVGDRRNQALGLALPPLLMLMTVAVLQGLESLNSVSAVAAQAVALIVSGIITLLTVNQRGTGQFLSIGQTLRAVRPFARVQIPEAASHRLDQAIMLPILGPEQSGYYSVAVTIYLLPYTFGQVLADATFRKIAGDSGPHRTSEDAASFVRPMVWAGAAVAAAIAASSVIGLELVLGSAFQPALTPTLVGLMGAPAVVALVTCEVELSIRQRVGGLAMAYWAGLAVGIALLFALGPHFGAVGASIASLAGYTASAGIALRLCRIGPRLLVPRRQDARLLRQIITGR